MNEKTKKLCGYIFAALVVVGLVLAIVGMFINVITYSASQGGVSASVSMKLFGDDLMDAAVETEIASTTFTIIAFIVTFVGAAILVVDAVLRLFLGKDIKVLRMAGAAVTLVGAILILVAGLVLAGQFNDTIPEKAREYGSYHAGAGIWLGFIGGLIAAVAGGLPLLKMFD